VSLDRNALATGIKKAMKDGLDKKQTADQVAEALADAIHAYTSAAEVEGIKGSVDDRPFDQDGRGKLR
jgi:hypothetical protein